MKKVKSNIEIIAAKETGLLGRVAVHLTKKGFKINRQTVTDQEDGKTCLMYYLRDRIGKAANKVKEKRIFEMQKH